MAYLKPKEQDYLLKEIRDIPMRLHYLPEDNEESVDVGKRIERVIRYLHKKKVINLPF